MQFESIMLAAYPVGSIYMSVNSTNPGTLFGGTWERITGRFLLAATDGGANGGNSNASIAPGKTGGEATHTLTQSEIANHGHGFTQPTVNGGASNSSITGGGHTHPLSADVRPRDNAQGWTTINGTQWYNERFAGRLYATSTTHTHNLPAHTHSVSGGKVSDMTGGGGAHNNMPPYLAVYVWKRTA